MKSKFIWKISFTIIFKIEALTAWNTLKPFLNQRFCGRATQFQGLFYLPLKKLTPLQLLSLKETANKNRSGVINRKFDGELAEMLSADLAASPWSNRAGPCANERCRIVNYAPKSMFLLYASFNISYGKAPFWRQCGRAPFWQLIWHCWRFNCVIGWVC